MVKKISMNDFVYFKITSSGHDILNENARRFHLENPHVDIQYKWQPYKGDVYRQQLWSLLSEFGDISYCGSILPVYDLSIEDPLEDGNNANN